MAKSLPWSWYSDPDVLRREQERIFRHAWQYVGHSGRVSEVGDRFSAWAGEIPVLVVRAEDGLRAFLNVCRHRGSLLVEGEGNGKSVQCPYHAWTYELDGSLRAAPRSDREPDFLSEGLSLVPLRLETWGPFLFVNPDAGAGPLADTLGPVTELIPVDDLVFHSRDDYSLAANWKIACENYLECYHCPVAHKGFSAAYDVDPDEYRLEPISEHVLSQFAHTRNGEEGQGQFHFVWPNLKINVLAGRPNLSIGPVLPDRPGTHDRLPRLLLRGRRRARLGRRAARVRPPGGGGGPRPRRASAERRSVGAHRRGSAAGGERAAGRAISGACFCGSFVKSSFVYTPEGRILRLRCGGLGEGFWRSWPGWRRLRLWSETAAPRHARTRSSSTRSRTSRCRHTSTSPPGRHSSAVRRPADGPDPADQGRRAEHVHDRPRRQLRRDRARSLLDRVPT